MLKIHNQLPDILSDLFCVVSVAGLPQAAQWLVCFQKHWNKKPGILFFRQAEALMNIFMQMQLEQELNNSDSPLQLAS